MMTPAQRRRREGFFRSQSPNLLVAADEYLLGDLPTELTLAEAMSMPAAVDMVEVVEGISDAESHRRTRREWNTKRRIAYQAVKWAEREEEWGRRERAREEREDRRHIDEELLRCALMRRARIDPDALRIRREAKARERNAWATALAYKIWCATHTRPYA